MDAKQYIRFDDRFERFLDATERLFDSLAVKRNRNALEDRFCREMLMLKLTKEETK